MEIKKAADLINANTCGAAWIAVVGLGENAISDVPELVQFEQTYPPDEKHWGLYGERFAVFTKSVKSPAINISSHGDVRSGRSPASVHGSSRVGAYGYASRDGQTAAPGTCVYRRPLRHEFLLCSGKPVPLRSVPKW